MNRPITNGTNTSASRLLTISHALIEAPVTTRPAQMGTATMLTNCSTTTIGTANGRSAFLANCAAFNDAALPAPRVANTRPGTYCSDIGDSSAKPHGAAGITTAFNTTIASTSVTRCNGATS